MDFYNYLTMSFLVGKQKNCVIRELEKIYKFNSIICSKSTQQNIYVTNFNHSCFLPY